MNTLGASAPCFSLASVFSCVTAGESLWKDLLGSHWPLSKGTSPLSSMSSMSLLGIFETVSSGARNVQIGPGVFRNWTVAPLERFATWSPCINVGSSHLNFYGLIFADFPQIVGVPVRRSLAEGLHDCLPMLVSCAPGLFLLEGVL